MKPKIHIGALAQGVASHRTLPYADYSNPIKRVICDALRIGWSHLCSEARRDGKNVDALDEDAITILYKEILNKMRATSPAPVPGFSPLAFETVVRDATVVSFDGAHVEKKPDLVFRTIPLSPAEPCSEYRGLFVESKIVSSAHPIANYANKGIARFVLGEYGWAMRSGLMLCYPRDGMTIPASLVPHLKKRAKDKTDELRIASMPAIGSAFGSNPRAYVSTHDRVWNYPRGRGRPGPIALTHLWLTVPK